MFGFVHFAELDSAAAHPPEQEMLLPSSQSAGGKKRRCTDICQYSVHSLSVQFICSISSKLRGHQLDKYLYPLLCSTAPWSPCALMLNHGQAVNIPAEGRIYKVVAINQRGAFVTSK